MTTLFFDFPLASAVLSIVLGVWSLGLLGIAAVILTVEIWLEILIAAAALDVCWDALQLVLLLVVNLAG